MNMEIDIKRLVYRTFPLPTYTVAGRNCDSFIFYLKGGHRFEYSGRTFIAEEGNMMYLPYKSFYKNYTLSENTEYYQVEFLIGNGTNAEPLFDELKLFSKETSEKYLSYFYDMYQSYSQANGEYDILYFSDLLKIIGFICREEDCTEMNSLKADKIEKIERTIKHIHEYYYLDTPLKDLATMSYMSISNLEKLFKSQLGLSPIAYRHKIRIEQAKLLLAGGYSVTETAGKVGYTDIFYFCRMFKKRCGDTPGNFALKNRKV